MLKNNTILVFLYIYPNNYTSLVNNINIYMIVKLFKLKKAVTEIGKEYWIANSTINRKD